MIRTLILLLSALILFNGCGGETSAKKIPTPVKIRAVKDYHGEDVVRYSAHIQPRQEVDLAFKVGGYIERLHQVRDRDGRLRDVQSGDRVSRGTVLARLRKSDYESRVNQARASLEEAKASLEKANLDLERATRLFGTESITKSEFDAAKAAGEGAKSRVDVIQAQLQEVEIALRDSDLIAPMDAVVVSRSIEAGDLAAVGSPGFVLADTRSVKAVFGVPDVLIGKFQIGQLMNVIMEALPGVEFQGVISQISPAADSRTRLFETEVSIDNRENQIKPGMIATIVVKASGASKTALVVPLTSIVESKENPEQYAVMVVETKNGKTIARQRDVSLGETFGDTIAVLQGVHNNEQVITTGATLVIDGEEVSIIP